MMKKLLLILGLVLAPIPASAQTIDALGAGSALVGTESIPMFQTANPALRTTPNAISTFTGGPSHPAYVANWWYVTPGAAITTNGAANIGLVTINCMPASYPLAVTIKGLGVGVSTGGAGNAQLAIYKDVSGRPGTLLSNTANIVTTATGTVTAALGANQLVGPGTVNGRNLWHCAMVDNATAVLIGILNTDAWLGQLVGSATASDVLASNASTARGVMCTTCAGGAVTYGTWPGNLGSGSTWTVLNANNTGFPVVLQIYQVVP